MNDVLLLTMITFIWLVYGLLKPEKALAFMKARFRKKRYVCAFWFAGMCLLIFTVPSYEVEGTHAQEARAEETVTDTPSTADMPVTTETPAVSEDSTAVAETPPVPGMELLWTKGSLGQYGIGEITGIVRNNTDKDCGYEQIIFGIYDDAGNKLGSAVANIASLEAHQSWRFKAIVTNDHFAQYKLESELDCGIL